MKKLIYLVVVGAMFIFTACNCGTGDATATEEVVTEEVVACADDCQKACCLGCKATEGEASCSLLAAGDHSCCAVKVESTEEELEDAHEGHDHSDGGHSH